MNSGRRYFSHSRTTPLAALSRALVRHPRRSKRLSAAFERSVTLLGMALRRKTGNRVLRPRDVKGVAAQMFDNLSDST
jgi:hypothetical protein